MLTYKYKIINIDLLYLLRTKRHFKDKDLRSAAFYIFKVVGCSIAAVGIMTMHYIVNV